jgi:hypothetical protein
LLETTIECDQPDDRNPQCERDRDDVDDDPHGWRKSLDRSAECLQKP